MVYASHHDPDLVGEPTLDELFEDPIMRLIMERDGVEESKMRHELDRVQRAYANFETVQ